MLMLREKFNLKFWRLGALRDLDPPPKYFQTMFSVPIKLDAPLPHLKAEKFQGFNR